MKATTEQLLKLGALMAHARMTETLGRGQTAARAEGVQAGVLATMVHLLDEDQLAAWCAEGEIGTGQIRRLLTVARQMGGTPKTRMNQESRKTGTETEEIAA